MDDLTDPERLAWHNKVVKVQSKVDYWSSQVELFNTELAYLEQCKNSMDIDVYMQRRSELTAENSTNITNLNSELRMLNHLQRTGTLSSTNTVPSGTSKRGAEVLEENISKKR